MRYFKLDKNSNPVECDIKGQEMRRVGFDKVGKYEVSTVFLGLDHGHGFTREPLLFETMIFGKGELDGYQTRCSTWSEAVRMHQEAIDLIELGCTDW